MEGKKDVKYSLIFLNYDPHNTKKWTKETKKLILKNSADYDYEFIEIKDVLGYVNAVNEGLKKATNEYILILNDDIIIEDKEWLSKLTNENAITSWRKNPFFMNREMMPDGACWSIHRPVYEKIGPMDKLYADGYGCDEIDYFYTAREAGFKLLSSDVDMSHLENQTYTSEYFIKDKEAMTTKNRNIFIDKWKEKLAL